MVHIKIDKQTKKKILLQVAAGWGLPRLTLAAHYYHRCGSWGSEVGRQKADSVVSMRTPAPEMCMAASLSPGNSALTPLQSPGDRAQSQKPFHLFPPGSLEAAQPLGVFALAWIQAPAHAYLPVRRMQRNQGSPRCVWVPWSLFPDWYSHQEFLSCEAMHPL